MITILDSWVSRSITTGIHRRWTPWFRGFAPRSYTGLAYSTCIADGSCGMEKLEKDGEGTGPRGGRCQHARKSNASVERLIYVLGNFDDRKPGSSKAEDRRLFNLL